MPSSDKSTKSRNRQFKTEDSAEEGNECFMCIAIGRDAFYTHIPRNSTKKHIFRGLMNHHRHQSTIIQRLNENSKSAGADQGSERASTKSAKSRKDKSTVQNPQPRVINHQQVHTQMQQQVFGDFSGHQQRMMTLTTSNENVNPWQLQESYGKKMQSGMYNSGN